MVSCIPPCKRYSHSPQIPTRLSHRPDCPPSRDRVPLLITYMVKRQIKVVTLMPNMYIYISKKRKIGLSYPTLHRQMSGLGQFFPDPTTCPPNCPLIAAIGYIHYFIFISVWYGWYIALHPLHKSPQFALLKWPPPEKGPWPLSNLVIDIVEHKKSFGELGSKVKWSSRIVGPMKISPRTIGPKDNWPQVVL